MGFAVSVISNHNPGPRDLISKNAQRKTKTTYRATSIFNEFCPAPKSTMINRETVRSVPLGKLRPPTATRSTAPIAHV